MKTQGSLFVGADYKADAARWIAECPEAFAEFCNRALAAQGTGAKLGARCIWEVMRWSMAIKKPFGEKFKLNDHLPPYVAREAERRFPQLEGFFEFRKAKDE